MSGLFLNLFECKFEKRYFDLQFLSYDKYAKKEAYIKLRDENPDYQLYRYDIKLKNGQTERRIYFWNKVKQPSTSLQGIKERVDIQKYPKITSKIIESCLVQHFRNFTSKQGQKYHIHKKREEHFWNIISPSNLMENQDQVFVEGIQVFNQLHFNTFFNSDNNYVSFYFVISRSLNIKFAIGRDDFEKRGIECKDLKGKDNIIFANRHSIKRFLSSTGQQGKYDDHFKKLEQSNVNFEVIEKIFNWLKKEYHKIYLPSENKFYEFSKKYLPLENDKIQEDKLEEPKRYYFENRTQNGRFDQVISSLKPYSFKHFENKEVRISIICPKFNEGILEGFINQLEIRLKKMFHIKPSFSNKFLTNTSSNTYEQAIYEDGVTSSDLCIVILNEGHKKIMDAKKSPY